MSASHDLRRPLRFAGAILLGLLVLTGVYVLNLNEQDAVQKALFMTGLLAVQVGVLAKAWTRSRSFRLLVAIAPIPLGMGTWFTGMAYGFDGGGPWTDWLLQAGFWMGVGGVLETIVVLCIPPK